MVPAVIAAVTALVFLPALACGFVWDDLIYLLGDADFRGFGARQVRWMFTTNYYGNYQPLTWITFALDRTITPVMGSAPTRPHSTLPTPCAASSRS